MITKDGYSTDPSIIPEGVVITFGKDMMIEQGGIKLFLSNFLQTMSNYEQYDYWMHKCSNLPVHEVDIIYIIVCNRLWAKVYCGGYRKGEADKIGYSANGQEKIIDWNYLVLSGPIEHAPKKRILKGFQGFRYCTQLF